MQRSLTYIALSSLALAALTGRVDADTTSIVTLHSFVGSDGNLPRSGLIFGSDGKLYGTTLQGGTNSKGTVYKTSTSGTFNSIHSFAVAEGDQPNAGLLLATDGNYYGTCSSDGAWSSGTIYKMTPAGVVSTVYSFAGLDDGYLPEGGLMQASNGILYGTTYAGGTNAYGTVYSLTTAGGFNSIYSFGNLTNDGRIPWSGLIEGADGVLYGTCYGGGAHTDGTVYKITTAGVETPLYSFTNGSDGRYPNAGLVQANDGSLYGATYLNPTNSGMYGTPFRITTSGTFNALTAFNNGNGSGPLSTLAIGSDGFLYGTTVLGGTSNKGVVYRIAPGGQITTLASFNGTNGAQPYGPVIQGGDGWFYGTTSSGGSSSDGSAYKFAIRGASVHNFVLLQNPTTNQIAIWRLTGRTVGKTVALSNVPAGFTVVGSGDFNGDAEPDVLLQNHTTGQLTIWYLDSSLGFVNTQNVTAVPGSGWNAVGVGDFNGDGSPDILFQNSSTGQLVVWFLTAGQKSGSASIAAKPGSWKVAGVGDMNWDTQTDIVFQNPSTGQLALWTMNGTVETSGTVLPSKPGAGYKLVGVVAQSGKSEPELVFQSGTSLAEWTLNGIQMTSGAQLSIVPPAGWTVVGPR